MKKTKNINTRYNFNTGKWAIRDNGEILAQGQGFPTYCKTVKEIEKNYNKKIVEKMINL